MIGSAVDDEGVVGQLGRDLARLSVRERQEDDVVAREVVGVGLEEGEVREGAQMGLGRDERHPGVGERRDGRHVEFWMRGEDSEELSTGITACACDGDG
ncbi:hypothetical protein GCM10025867_24320 [Frondihabitans sucicola]|uniref:Uncharacterized protein n=1 Tax=Frondihabitans sucicola TaxID=1268041 RepID=A0ABM8GP14_9MICO|nr:hypothetical protein GCM10025867_24320 [Frondihabitans sucicola]